MKLINDFIIGTVSDRKQGLIPSQRIQTEFKMQLGIQWYTDKLLLKEFINNFSVYFCQVATFNIKHVFSEIQGFSELRKQTITCDLVISSFPLY